MLSCQTKCLVSIIRSGQLVGGHFHGHLSLLNCWAGRGFTWFIQLVSPEINRGARVVINKVNLCRLNASLCRSGDLVDDSTIVSWFEYTSIDIIPTVKPYIERLPSL